MESFETKLCLLEKSNRAYISRNTDLTRAIVGHSRLHLVLGLGEKGWKIERKKRGVCLTRTMEQLQKDFFDFRYKRTENIKREAEKLKKDPNPKIYDSYVAKYPFLKKAKYPFPSLRQVLSWEETKGTFAYDTHTKLLLDLFISKITGIFKHGQTMKTALCNRRIISNIKNNKLTIAISKNTLSAKEQWEQRLIDSLREEFPDTILSEIILIISSKENTLNGNATHCKNVEKASFIMNKRNSAYKLIFICSNNTRIHDMIELLESTKEEQLLPVEIIHDEAHKNDEGIPSKREMVEYLIMHPRVETYIPVTASPGPLFLDDTKEVLWQRANLERNASDYTDYCNIVSTSENYSSIADANQLRFDQYKNHSSYTDYNIYEFDEETFDEADMPSYYADKRKWDNPEDIRADKSRRRQLEFCSFMAFEKDALNIGMNILDNCMEATYKEGTATITTKLILPGMFNFHLMTTPCRVALTISLIKHALTQTYNPICIGLYRSKIYIWYKNGMGQTIREEYGDLDIDTQSQEMNSKLNEILDFLKRKGEPVERPFLVFGNYKPTGESITFVNYAYGTIRSDTLLPVVGQTREMNYQGLLRCAYTDSKFKERNPSFVHPPKWIIGSEKTINDAITYEEENDARVRSFESGTHTILIPVVIPTAYPAGNDDMGISVPVQIIVTDTDDMYYKEVQSILKEDIRTEKVKKTLLNCFRLLKDNHSLQINDPTGKFDLNSSFRIKEVTIWKTPTESQRMDKANRQENKYTPYESDYKFREYEAAHKTNRPYINNKSKIKVNDCDFLAAVDCYKLNGFKNTANIFWLSYRYATDKLIAVNTKVKREHRGLGYRIFSKYDDFVKYLVALGRKSKFAPKKYEDLNKYKDKDGFLECSIQTSRGATKQKRYLSEAIAKIHLATGGDKAEKAGFPCYLDVADKNSLVWLAVVPEGDDYKSKIEEADKLVIDQSELLSKQMKHYD